MPSLVSAFSRLWATDYSPPVVLLQTLNFVSQLYPQLISGTRGVHCDKKEGGGLLTSDGGVLWTSSLSYKYNWPLEGNQNAAHDEMEFTPLM